VPDWRQLSDIIARFASSGALGFGVASSLLAVALLVLKAKDRARLRFPAALLALDLVTLLLRAPLDPASALTRTIANVSLLFVLLALGRTSFILVVDWFLGERLRRPLPRIIHDIVQGVVYVLAILITLRAAGVEPGSLLTTSALLTAVVGLSLQDTLGNLFAGLSIQAQRPFEVGDWIQIDSDNRFIGRVIEINWRATTVLTLEHVELIIPNGALAKTPIKNFTKPSPLSRRTIEVVAPYDASPRKVEAALLQALWSAPGVLTEPPPFVLMPKFADSGIAYHLCYFIDDFARRDRVDTLVRQRIWYSLRRAGIELPFPTTTVHVAESSAEARAHEKRRQEARRLEALRGVDFLASVPPPLLERLAALSETCEFAAGEVILRQGDPGQELYIVLSGEVSVLVGRTGGSTAEVARLGPGKFLGEMSLMTGERRSATAQAIEDCEVVRVSKDAFHDILAAAPELAERITKVLIERQMQIDENVSARRARPEAEAAARTVQLLDKVRKFFSL
jgi:small-conductance mechanosensitive channel/CRP-like cAMP-binding protein